MCVRVCESEREKEMRQLLIDFNKRGEEIFCSFQMCACGR